MQLVIANELVAHEHKTGWACWYKWLDGAAPPLHDHSLVPRPHPEGGVWERAVQCLPRVHAQGVAKVIGHENRQIAIMI